jgi:hypothetical protein
MAKKRMPAADDWLVASPRRSFEGHGGFALRPYAINE